MGFCIPAANDHVLVTLSLKIGSLLVGFMFNTWLSNNPVAWGA